MSVLLFLLPFVSSAPAQPTLTVAAAADLSTLGPDLAALYEHSYPAKRVRFVFSGSALLKQQIAASAPFDVFLSANAAYVDDLAAAGKILPESVLAYTQGRVGVLWRDGRKHPLRDLTTSQVRFLALPNPQLAPYGVAAQQALEYGGLWAMVQPKVVYAENVRQALQMVESGNADAVLTSDALLQGKPSVEVIPEDWHKPIIQKAGVVAVSSQRQAALQFVEFLKSADVQALFSRYGFSAPPKP